MSIENVITCLKEYDGPTIKLMEVCGSHTAAIAKYGIRTMISPKIQLVSGPGCPVCVTPSSYIDRLIELACTTDVCVVTFGDLLRVPGSKKSLSDAKPDSAKVKMVYSPMDTLKLAKQDPNTTYIFAAVGFETTTPVYALMIEQMIKQEIKNVKLLTSIKTMPAAIDWLCSNEAMIDGFIAPGHVCAVIGWSDFVPLAKKYQVPFGVAGFNANELLFAIYGIVQMIEKKQKDSGAEFVDQEELVKNFYPSVVTKQGNVTAKEKIDIYFEPCDAVWRGMGCIAGSGRVLRKAYEQYDAGSVMLTSDHKINAGCCCDQILMGKMQPPQCPLFGKVCNPQTPQGACMVSYEGSCYQYHLNAH